MTAVAFDTLKLARALRDDAHFPADQAEEMARVFSEAFRDELVTKADLNEAKAELRTEIGEVRREIVETRAELKSDMADIDRRIDVLEAHIKAEFAPIKWAIFAMIPALLALLAKAFLH